MNLPDWITRDIIVAAAECDVSLEDIEEAYIHDGCSESIAREAYESRIPCDALDEMEPWIDWEGLGDDMEGTHFVEEGGHYFRVL